MQYVVNESSTSLHVCEDSNEKLFQQLERGEGCHMSAASAALRIALPDAPGFKKARSGWQLISKTVRTGGVDDAAAAPDPVAPARNASDGNDLPSGRSAWSKSIAVLVPRVGSVRLQSARGKPRADTETEIGIWVSQPLEPIDDPSVPQTQGSTIVTLQDRYVFINRSGQELEWRQASEGSATLLDALTLPSDGKPVPLMWSRASASRRVCVRPAGNSHSWSEAFPASTGDCVIKMPARGKLQASQPAGGGSGDGGGGGRRPFYLHLVVVTRGAQQQLVLRSLESRHYLPLQVANRTTLLMAFRQDGSDPRTEWETLGAGEQCDYAWSNPVRRHSNLAPHVCGQGLCGGGHVRMR